ncbi:MAG: L-threonylcarbamoyladenylate synthase [candidate division NC10 bacterium]
MIPTRICPVDASHPEPSVLQEAASSLRQGKLVGFPTETFYGLGANAMDREAVARVFRVKGRAESKPLLILVDSVRMAESLALELSDIARTLMATYWPGPLTLVFRASAELPPALGAGAGTVGMRMPGHPVALALVRAAGFPVTAPSANPSGEEPPTTAEAVRRFFDGKIELILDGGPTAGGRPSTVLDLSVSPPRLIRHGVVELSDFK